MTRYGALAGIMLFAYALSGPAGAASCPPGDPSGCKSPAHQKVEPPGLTLKQWRQIQQQNLRQLQNQNEAERNQLNLQEQQLQQNERDRTDQASKQQQLQQSQQNTQAAQRRQACLNACAAPMACLPVPGTTPTGIAPQTFCDGNRAQCQAGCR